MGGGEGLTHRLHFICALYGAYGPVEERGTGRQAAVPVGVLVQRKDSGAGLLEDWIPSLLLSRWVTLGRSPLQNRTSSVYLEDVAKILSESISLTFYLSVCLSKSLQQYTG